MSKSLFIAEKPSVASEFAKALKVNASKTNGYIESDQYIITWCVGHLITMSYPDKYDPALRRWTLQTLPFLPKTWKYEVIPSVKQQFDIVKHQLNRPDVDTIYVCTDSGREGEYIYRLVEQEAHVQGKTRRRVWIDSQTEEEILRGIRQAKDLSAYDHLADAAYLRAKEDYLMGINFSRLLTLKYGNSISNYLRTDRTVLSVGRVMTCVLGMIVRREREIREFKKTPFYRIISTDLFEDNCFEGEWRAVEGSKYFASPYLYKENGFKEKEVAMNFICELYERAGIKKEQLMGLIAGMEKDPPDQMKKEAPDVPALTGTIVSIERRKEKKNPPLLYNLAELQNDCAKMFKISPDQTLSIVQELYEKKLVTYPRTDARVLTTAVCKEIDKNLKGLCQYQPVGEFANEILSENRYASIAKTRYTNDKQVTDHYAIIPTGQGLSQLYRLSDLDKKVYETIARRFLAIFYPAAEFQKTAVTVEISGERFFSNFKNLLSEGYLKVMNYSFIREKKTTTSLAGKEEASDQKLSVEVLSQWKKGMELTIIGLALKAGETSPPKRYYSGSMILAMENAGQLIEDEELREQIRGSGIGTSATRAEILKKLEKIGYILLNKKTQVITPTQLGEMVYDVVNSSIRQLLNPELTASWEKGLSYVSEGTITSEEYMQKLEGFVSRRTSAVMMLNNQYELKKEFDKSAPFYQKKKETGSKKINSKGD